ncbi:MAG: Mitochondrial intermediate peptidase [Piccolia ochrophora]|nr:MAG: Mitochondrial intermediate peptidase [Piccolia ochrophora]
MLTAIRRPPWICPSCVSRRRLDRRSLAVAATATAPWTSTSVLPPVAPASSVGTAQDDKALRQIFDSPGFWKDFSQRAKTSQPRQRIGLFQNRYLTSPEGFHAFATTTLKKCSRIVDKVKRASSVHDYTSIARDLDRLSDLLCRVIDLSDFVRGTHPDVKVQHAATNAYQLMFQYMNELNTTTELNDQLKRALANPDVTKTWSAEEKTVALILMKDFSKSAIDMPEGERQRFVDLSNDISRVGTAFVDGMAPQKTHIDVDSNRLTGLDSRVARPLTRWGRQRLQTIGAPATWALRTIDDENVRRDLYMAHRTSHKDQIARLEELLHGRAELARVCGYDSYAHMTLADKMARSPGKFQCFLTALHRDNQPRMQRDISYLQSLKQEHLARSDSSVTFNAWDKEYYTALQISRTRPKSRDPDFLSAHFSLGTVLQGLSRLFTRLYGIRLVPQPTGLGETWNNDVRRLDVVDETEGHIAVIYCDLFSRAGKNPNPAHYTVRCSRRIHEEHEDPDLDRSDTFPLTHLTDAFTDGMASTRDAHGALHQLPTIALICDFPTPSPSRSPTTKHQPPTLLTFRDVETLFHEMGHALQSILGRTSLQNVSGTRCATDFAELPSVLMERFARAPEVLALFARHWDTDAPLPYSLVAERVALDRASDAAEIESQILYATLDQAYHSPLPLRADFDSSAVFHAVCAARATLPEPEGTAWQGMFGHLFGYGATYYSYIFDRAIAGKIWKEVFQREEGGAVSREAGEVFRDEVLKWGGSRDGWKCVAGALRDEGLTEGGEGAMAEVGRWGVRE